jgi:hypothetical protein
LMAKRSSKSAGSLFSVENRLLFATNRANVLSILSSGLIRARAAYEKYYDDLLALCPGQFLLFHREFPRSLLPFLSDQEPGLFPVLVEVDPKGLLASPTQIRITRDLALNMDQSGVNEDVLCDVVSAPIPIAAVTRLCFASQDHLDDFQARSFENMLPLPPLAVTATAFGENGPEPERFKSVLQSVPPAAGSSEDFRRIDAAMGAMAMLCLLLLPSKSWIEAVAMAASFPNQRKTTAVGAPRWLTSMIERIASTKTAKTHDLEVDERLMAAAIAVLLSKNPRDGWVESQVASEIASGASQGAAPGQTKDIESWRDVVTAVAKTDRQVGSLDDTGSVVRRGLMLLILRCQPERIIRAAETPLMPGPQVTAVAGILSGLFHGYSRLSREIKIRACAPEVLSRLALSWWSIVDGEQRKLAINTSARRDDPTTARFAVTVERATLVERIVHPNNAMMRLFYHAKSVGYAFEYDPNLDTFVLETGEKGRKRRITIETGRPSLHGQATIRVRTTCLSENGKPVRLSKREDAVALLERNHDPVTQCRFAVEPISGNVEVLAHQLLETMDSPELQSHIEAVTKTADEFEVFWANRLPPPPRRAGKGKNVETP